MVSIDITDWQFVSLPADETNSWLDQYVGKIIHDEPEYSAGEGWKVYYDFVNERWMIDFHKAEDATLFTLRWS